MKEECNLFILENKIGKEDISKNEQCYDIYKWKRQQKGKRRGNKKRQRRHLGKKEKKAIYI